MASFIAPMIYVLLFKGLMRITICNELPVRCSGSSSMSCGPVIPTYVQFYGWNLIHVKQLYLFNDRSRWALPTLPSGLFNWASNIEYIYMIEVGLENLKCDIFQPLRNSLYYLNMNYNLFREFPSCALKNLNRLENIHFSQQNIESVEINNMELNSLTYIDLRRNQISNFSISNINNINDVQIFLDNNNITYLNISRVNRIHTLSVKSNQLVEIHQSIFQTSHSTLADLDLSYNNLDDEVWKVFEGITALTTLKLKQNMLETVSPSVITRLSELYYLDLSHNYISSLRDVLLRSGKITTVLLNSNKLVNFPSNTIHAANTFRNGYHCELDISNNMMDNIQLNMPSTNTKLTLNLGKNELTSIYFNTNENEIESLNISGNHLVTLPETLPKAKRYIISNNPLTTMNVLKHLTTTMKDATQIEMDDINFLCNKSEQYDFTNLQLSKIVTFFLRRNCIPLMFLCHIDNSKINIYLDDNKHHFNSTNDIPCELHAKMVGTVSFSGSRMYEFLTQNNTKTMSNVASLYLKNSQLRKLPFMRTASISNHVIHIFDFSENFLEAFNGLEYTYHDSLTLNLENNRITKLEKVTWKKNESIYYRNINLKYMHNHIARVDSSCTLIEFIGMFKNIYISIDLSFNRLYAFDLASVINYNNNDSYFIVQNLNVSHNDLEVYHNCLHIRVRFQKSDFSYNKLKELPDNSCRYAIETYLGHNSITEIGSTLPTASISKLDLEWNLIQYIHDYAFANMTSIMTLNLRGNKLKNFPKAVQKIRYLTTLDISYNGIINIKESDIDGKMEYLTSLILTGNDLAPHPSTSIGLLRPIPGLELRDNLITCDCDVLFLRNHTLNTKGRCSFPSEFEGYLISCFPAESCVRNVPLYIYRETKSMCLKDDFFDIKISMVEVDEILSVGWKRLGPLKQTGIKMKVYRKQIIVKEIVVNETGQTNSIFLSHSLNADRLCLIAYLNDRTFERCVDIHHTRITGKSNNMSEKHSNNGAIYGTSAVLVLSVLLNILGSIFIFVFNRRKRPTIDANSNQFANNAYVPNEYEMSFSRHGGNDQQLDVYDQLSENSNNITGGGAYENLNI